MGDWKAWFSFRGRASRRQYWQTLLVLVGISFALLALGGIPAAQVIGAPVSLVANVAQWALVARRLHDLNRSGWWQVPAMVLGMAAVLQVVSMGEAGVEANPGLSTAMLGAMLLSLAFVVAIGVAKGDPGPNRYGQPPAPRPG